MIKFYGYINFKIVTVFHIGYFCDLQGSYILLFGLPVAIYHFTRKKLTPFVISEILR